MNLTQGIKVVESGVWEVVKVVVQFAVAPVLGFLAWVYKRQDIRISELEERMAMSEKDNAVIDVKIDYIFKSIQRIEENIVKLVDKK